MRNRLLFLTILLVILMMNLVPVNAVETQPCKVESLFNQVVTEKEVSVYIPSSEMDKGVRY